MAPRPATQKILLISRPGPQRSSIEAACLALGIEVFEPLQQGDVLRVIHDPTLIGGFIDILEAQPNGFSLCSQLKKQRPELTLIVTSTTLRDQSFVEEDIIRAKADGFLGRSFVPEKLRGLLRGIQSKSTPEPHSCEGGEGLIMVVEDNPTLLRLCTRHLEALGFEVLSVSNGVGVLDVFLEHQPDLCLVDLLLPGRNGLDVCREIRKTSHGRAVPLILMSGSSTDLVAAKSQVDEVGFDGCLLKPFTLQALQEILQNHLASHNTQPPRSSVKGDMRLMHLEQDTTAFLNTDMPSRGDLARDHLGSLLYRLGLRKSTGSLLLRHKHHKRVISFTQGIPTSISRLPGDTSLAQFLVEHHFVDAEVMDRLCQNSQHWGSLGARLQEQGLLTSSQIQRVREVMARDRLLLTFKWEEGQWGFTTAQSAHKGLPLNINLFLVLREVVERACSSQTLLRLHTELAPLYVSRTGLFESLAEHITLNPEERQLLMSFDGHHRVREILSKGTMPLREALLLMWTLHQMRMLVFPLSRDVSRSSSMAVYTPQPMKVTPRSLPIVALERDKGKKGEGEPTHSVWKRMFDRDKE